MPNNYSMKRYKVSNYRRCQSSTQLIRSLMQLEADVLNKDQSLRTSMQKLRKFSDRLRDCISKVAKCEKELREHTKQFQIATNELGKTAQDIRTLYNFKDKKEDMLLNVHATRGSEEATITRQQIKHIHKELDQMSPIVEETRNAPDGWVRCYDRVVIPEITIHKMSNSSPQTAPTKARTCSVCLESEADCAIVDCGHVCMCQECTCNYITESGNKKCPLCRATITDIIVPTPI